ncbi:hypothetical protein HKD37_04G011407 [Glycine soja]
MNVNQISRLIFFCVNVPNFYDPLSLSLFFMSNHDTEEVRVLRGPLSSHEEFELNGSDERMTIYDAVKNAKIISEILKKKCVGEQIWASTGPRCISQWLGRDKEGIKDIVLLAFADDVILFAKATLDQEFGADNKSPIILEDT